MVVDGAHAAHDAHDFAGDVLRMAVGHGPFERHISAFGADLEREGNANAYGARSGARAEGDKALEPRNSSHKGIVDSLANDVSKRKRLRAAYDKPLQRARDWVKATVNAR